MDHSVLETDRHRYAVVSPLAEGGMGAIYLGRRVSTGPATQGRDRQAADVVLKQLLPEHTADPKLIEMFLREARLTASLDHPNIVRTLDLVNAGDDYFMVLEYVRGGDLRSLLRRAKRRQARFGVDAAIFVVNEVLNALHYAHTKVSPNGKPLGLIHRDVSPSNILLGSSGEVKLTDFGIAKAPSQGSVVFKVKGKVGYMAPEQARGEPVDLRTDLFAVGVVLHEMLTGERLFVGNALSPAAVIFAQPIKAPSRKRPEVSAELDAIVLRALSLDREGRFSSAREFNEALLALVERERRDTGREMLAEELRRSCGEDSAHWLSLDVPAHATLDGGGTTVEGPDGTGVILTDDDSDEWNDRPASLRTALPPAKELTSVIPVGEDEFDGTATTVAPDPFGKTHLAPLPPTPPRGAPTERPVLREPAPTPKPPAAPRPPARPTRPGETGSRAVFAPPIPRQSPPPPSDDFTAPVASSAPAPAPTADSGRLSLARRAEPAPPIAVPAPPQTTPRFDLPKTSPILHNPEPGRYAAGTSQPANLGRSGRTKIVLTIAFILLLVALGIGVGALLSGGSPDFNAQ